MKLLLIILVLLEVFLTALAVGPVLVDRRDLARAISRYRQAPTEENRKIMKREQAVTARIRLHTRMAVAALLALNTGGMIVVYRRLHRAPRVR
jgi:hypothetical protein